MNTVDSGRRFFSRPRVVVSKCLGFEAVRYNGAIIPCEFVDRLRGTVDFFPVCPEMEIGLGTPRDPIHIVRRGSEDILHQPATGRDLSERMNRFSEKFLRSLSDVDGFILKSRSPSCGIKEVKIHSDKEKSPAIGKGPGFFGGKVLESYPGLAIEDEGRLLNLKIREHFLTRIFAFAAFREIRSSGSMGQLVQFQAQNKLLLMSYSQKEMRLLGKIVANHEKQPFEKVATEYALHLQMALLKPSRDSNNINTLMHALGYFSKKVPSREKKFFLGMLEKYRNKRVMLPVPVGILRGWVYRFEEPYLMGQTFFEPYPEELVEIFDSGRGREIG